MTVWNENVHFGHTATFALPESMESYRDDIVKIIDSIYDPAKLAPEDASKNNVSLHLDKNKLNRKEFQELWKQISAKTAYIVDFDTDELIRKAIQQINTELHVSRIFAVIESGEMGSIHSKDDLLEVWIQDARPEQGAYSYEDKAEKQILLALGRVRI